MAKASVAKFRPSVTAVSDGSEFGLPEVLEVEERLKNVQSVKLDEDDVANLPAAVTNILKKFTELAYWGKDDRAYLEVAKSLIGIKPPSVECPLAAMLDALEHHYELVLCGEAVRLQCEEVNGGSVRFNVVKAAGSNELMNQYIAFEARAFHAANVLEKHAADQCQHDQLKKMRETLASANHRVTSVGQHLLAVERSMLRSCWT